MLLISFFRAACLFLSFVEVLFKTGIAFFLVLTTQMVHRSGWDYCDQAVVIKAVDVELDMLFVPPKNSKILSTSSGHPRLLQPEAVLDRRCQTWPSANKQRNKFCLSPVRIPQHSGVRRGKQRDASVDSQS